MKAYQVIPLGAHLSFAGRCLVIKEYILGERRIGGRTSHSFRFFCPFLIFNSCNTKVLLQRKKCTGPRPILPLAGWKIRFGGCVRHFGIAERVSKSPWELTKEYLSVGDLTLATLQYNSSGGTLGNTQIVLEPLWPTLLSGPPNVFIGWLIFAFLFNNRNVVLWGNLKTLEDFHLWNMMLFPTMSLAANSNWHYSPFKL
jgi:hypothetical protein